MWVVLLKQKSSLLAFTCQHFDMDCQCGLWLLQCWHSINDLQKALGVPLLVVELILLGMASFCGVTGSVYKPRNVKQLFRPFPTYRITIPVLFPEWKPETMKRLTPMLIVLERDTECFISTFLLSMRWWHSLSLNSYQTFSLGLSYPCE